VGFEVKTNNKTNNGFKFSQLVLKLFKAVSNELFSSTMGNPVLLQVNRP
jgi:hypothetical protein